MFRVVVAGSRHFEDYELLTERLDHLLSKHDDVVVVSGTCRGADTLGERWAAEHGYPVERFPADWSSHGRAAGPIRNAAMADVADAVVIFWVDDSPTGSRGCRSMLSCAQERSLPIRVVHSRLY